MCSDFGVSVLYNSGVIDFCLQHIALVSLLSAHSPGCWLAHRDQCCLLSSEDGLFLKIYRGFGPCSS